ncbi:MAG: alpha/beta fold hydrolase [Phycisphaerales bacterium JB040]
MVWLHGSPGGKENFTALGPRLAAFGRSSVALDLPGFGQSAWRVPDVGARAHAQYVLAAMSTLGIERAHVVGWSNGGAVALHMADIESDRVATVTLLASVGLQETEGSGSYAFEHGKYLAGLAVFRGLQLGTPDFGFFGSARDLGWLWNFRQTDQRLLRPIMEGLETPTLILHGRHDFLTPAWGAELHHAAIPTSRLVMLDGGHFMPMAMPDWLPIREASLDDVAGVLNEHFERHDVPGVEPLTGYDNRAPLPERRGVARGIEWVGVHLRDTPWWVLVPVIAGLARWRPMLTVVLVGMYVGRTDLDIGVAWLGVWAGRMLRRPTLFDVPRWPLGWLTRMLGSFAALSAVFLAEQDTFSWRLGPDDLTLRFGVLGLGLWLVLGPVLLHALVRVCRRRGRQYMLRTWSRWTNHEWWSCTWIYISVWPMWVGRVFTKHGPWSFTAANPGIGNGGGFVDESKDAILRALPDDANLLAFHAIGPEGTPEERAARALEAVESRPELGGFPIICKPATGENGKSIRRATNADDLRDYFGRISRAVQLQRYHPGPCEYGVFWVRSSEAGEGRSGIITGVCRKRFLSLTGDGERTFGELILSHRRFRCQARMFHHRHAGRWDTVLPEGESVTLGLAANHVQGAKFEDASDIVTPELAAAIDRLASGFKGQGGGGLDFGRFDVRATSEEAFQRGEFGVIELNGVTSEPIHLYEPDHSFFRAWAILRAHWKHLYRVADDRIASGGTPLTTVQALRLWRKAKKREVIASE